MMPEKLPQPKRSRLTFWVSTASGLVALSALITGLFAVDSRYVHAADFEKYQKEQTVQFQSIKTSFLLIRKQMLEDQLFQLEIKKNLNDSEKLTKRRLETQIQDLQRKIDTGDKN